MIKLNDNEYSTLEDVWNESKLMPEEKAEIIVKTELMGKLIEMRETLGFTQEKLASLCGIKQPFLARIEKGTPDPRLTTLLKILAPLGYTLAIVPQEKTLGKPG